MSFSNQEVKELYTEVMQQIKITKKKFITFIKYKNEKKIKLNDDIIEHLKKLIELWKCNQDANIDYYFIMKQHHSHINGKIYDTPLKQLWDDYIEIGANLRTSLLRLNYLMREFNTTTSSEKQDLSTHNYLPPQTLSQSITRNTLKELMKNIKEPHCEICGDTENESKILKIKTQLDNIYLCDFCYNVQINM